MKKRRLLAIDIGNTSILAALYARGRFVKSLRVPTDRYREAARKIKKLVPREGVEAAVIASVVPAAGRHLRQNLPKLGVRTLLIGKDIQAPIQNRYKNPKQVGVDRLMNAVAAFKHFRRAAIVVDFGTAITFDVVSEKGAYLGGVIAPGIEISLEALFQKTALLPKIRLMRPRGILGANTVESIRAGCSFGIGGLCDRVIQEVSRACRFRKPVILATGGYAKFMAKYCHSLHKICPDLTLQGILLTYQASKK